MVRVRTRRNLGVVRMGQPLHVRLAVVERPGSVPQTAYALFSRGTLPAPPLKGLLRLKEVSTRIVLSLGDAAVAHEFEPPLYMFKLSHRGTAVFQFTDKSQFEVSGLVTYPVWNWARA